MFEKDTFVILLDTFRFVLLVRLTACMAVQARLRGAMHALIFSRRWNVANKREPLVAALRGVAGRSLARGRRLAALPRWRRSLEELPRVHREDDPEIIAVSNMRSAVDNPSVVDHRVRRARCMDSPVQPRRWRGLRHHECVLV